MKHRRHASSSIIGTVCAAAALRPNAPKSNSPPSAISSRICSCSGRCRASLSFRLVGHARQCARLRRAKRPLLSRILGAARAAQYRRHAADRDGCVLPRLRHRDRGAGRLAQSRNRDFVSAFGPAGSRTRAHLGPHFAIGGAKLARAASGAKHELGVASSCRQREYDAALRSPDAFCPG